MPRAKRCRGYHVRPVLPGRFVAAAKANGTDIRKRKSLPPRLRPSLSKHFALDGTQKSVAWTLSNLRMVIANYGDIAGYHGCDDHMSYSAGKAEGSAKLAYGITNSC